MPITQTRMQDVLAENQMLTAHLASLRSDAENIVNSGLSAEHRIALLLIMLNVDCPATPHSEREREHFAKAQRRNAQSAIRMREVRRKNANTEGERR